MLRGAMTAPAILAPKPEALSHVRSARYGGALILALCAFALFYYKWGGSLRVLGRVHSSGKLGISPAALLDGGVVATTLFYFGKIWPALVFGILVGSALRGAIPGSWVKRWLGPRGARPTITGALAGTPLMLCSCCSTPVFTGLYERGARLGPALAVMLASPGLNIAAIVLTFALLPARLAAVRLVAALVIVLGLSAAIGRAMDTGRAPHRIVSTDECADEDASLRASFLRFARSVAYLTVVTVPLIFVGVLLSGLLLPHVAALSQAGTVVAIAVVALVGVLVALPTFFEIPVALLLLASGAPLGVAVAFVVAGPIVNMPSLFVLARESRPRVAVALAAGVWLVATAAGLASMA
jgi:uncharacterized membrane protein YraQ (UPF0718 family)